MLISLSIAILGNIKDTLEIKIDEIIVSSTKDTTTPVFPAKNLEIIKIMKLIKKITPAIFIDLDIKNNPLNKYLKISFAVNELLSKIKILWVVIAINTDNVVKSNKFKNGK